MTNDKYQRVRNLLGVPQDDALMDGWSHDQLRDYVTLETQRDVKDIREKGCNLHPGICHQVGNLRRSRSLLVGLASGFGAIAVVLSIMYYFNDIRVHSSEQNVSIKEATQKP